MPVIDDQMVLTASNRALAELIPPGAPLDSLNSVAKSDPEWSCNNFGPAVLQYVSEAAQSEGETTNYKGDPSTWPESFPEQSLVNFSINFKNSSSNHNFNVYFKANNGSYRLQVYIGNSIQISTFQSSDWFIALWKQLATEEWATAYETLFYVKPVTEGNAYTEQYVTVVIGS